MKKLSVIVFLFFFIQHFQLFAQIPDSIPQFKKFRSYKDKSIFTKDSLNCKHKQVFVLYDPGCGHCQELGYELSKQINELDSLVDYYFIAMQGKEQVDGYINMFAKGLKDHPRVTFLHDPEGEFILLFNPKNFPSTYIYDRKSLRLLFQVDGERKWIKMLPYLIFGN